MTVDRESRKLNGMRKIVIKRRNTFVDDIHNIVNSVCILDDPGDTIRMRVGWDGRGRSIAKDSAQIVDHPGRCLLIHFSLFVVLALTQ